MADQVFIPHRPFVSLYILDKNEINLYLSTHNPVTEQHDRKDVLIVKHWIKEEDSLINLPFEYQVGLATIMLISLLVGSYFKGIMYAYVFSTNKENRGWMHRPINVLIITSSVIHHISHIWMWSWYVITFLLAAPVSDVLGFHWCQIMQIVGGFGLCYLTVGGVGITIYRLLFIKCEDWVKYVIGQECLLVIILSTSFLFCWIIVFMYAWEGSLSRPTLNTTLNQCQGVSILYSQILIEYELSRGLPMKTTSHLQIIAVGLCIAMQTFELLSYIYIFYYRYKNDNGNVARLLTHDVTRDRNLKNVQTFIGQFYGFLTEYAFLFFWLIVIMLSDEQTYSVKTYANVVKFMDFGILSAVEYFTSPILRQFMR